MSIRNRQIGWSGKANALYAILKELSALSGQLSNFSTTTTTTSTLMPYLKLVFNSPNFPVGNPSNVGDWNILFQLPGYGNPFTSVNVTGNEVKLYGGSNITLRDGLFINNNYITQVDDVAGCVVQIASAAFSSSSVTSVSFPAVTYIGFLVFYKSLDLTSALFPAAVNIDYQAFKVTTSLTSLSLPNVTSIGYACFEQSGLNTLSIPTCTDLGGTVGDDGVFASITGRTFTLTVPRTLMDCNSGNPDGDIQYLQANNTVTIIQV